MLCFLRGARAGLLGSEGFAFNINQWSWSSSGDWDPHHPCTATPNRSEAELLHRGPYMCFPSGRPLLGETWRVHNGHGFLMVWIEKGRQERSSHFSSVYTCSRGRFCSVLGGIRYGFQPNSTILFLSFSKMAVRRHCCNGSVFWGGFQIPNKNIITLKEF